MSDPQIVCPQCSTPIKLTESLAAPLIAQTRKQFEQQLASKEVDFARREAVLQQTQQDLAKAREAVDEEVAKKLKAERASIAEAEARKARVALGNEIEQRDTQLKELQKNLSANNAKLAEAQQAQADVLRKQRELDDARRELDLSVEKKVQESLVAVRAKAKLDAEEGLKAKLSEKEQQVASMKIQIDDLRRKAEQGSQQLQGEPSETVLLTKTRLREKLAKLEEEVKRLAAIEKALLASPDQQISLTDPDCRSMATSGRGSGMVAYNVQSAVDTTNHLIVAHEVTNVGTDRSQLATMAQAAKAALRSDNLDVVADRGYFKGEEILACEQAGVAVTLPKPQTSGAKSAGRFGKPDFVYLAKDDVYRCPAGEKLAHHFTADEDGQKMRIYLTKACRTCPFKDQCTTSNERRIKRWEHEHVVEAVQTRLDQNPQAMRVRRETVEHPFATLKMRMGATHFLMKRLPNVATEMALNVLAYNLTRVMNIVGIKPLLVAIRA